MASIAEKPIDLSEWVYNIIRDRIMDGTYTAGQQLNIEEISTELGVSRTPTREALLKLRNDKFVRSESRVGFFVQELSNKDIDEIYELRDLIQCYSAECAARRITDEEAQELREIQAESVVCAEKFDYDGFYSYVNHVHDYIDGYIENERIREMLINVNSMIERIRRANITDLENVRISSEEHGAIVEAIIRHDPDEARRLMREHLVNAKRRLLGWLS